MTVRASVKRHRRRLMEAYIPELKYPWYLQLLFWPLGLTWSR